MVNVPSSTVLVQVAGLLCFSRFPDVVRPKPVTRNELDKLITAVTRRGRAGQGGRQVSESEVLDVLKGPSRVEESAFGRKNAAKLFGERILRVTYKETDQETVVITVVWKDLS